MAYAPPHVRHIAEKASILLKKHGVKRGVYTEDLAVFYVFDDEGEVKDITDISVLDSKDIVVCGLIEGRVRCSVLKNGERVEEAEIHEDSLTFR